MVGPRVIREHLMYYIVGPSAVRLQSGAQELQLQPETFFWLQPGVTHTFTLAETGTAAREDARPPRTENTGGRASSRAADFRSKGAPTAEVIFFRCFLGVHNQPLRLREPCLQRTLEPELGARLEELLPEHLPAGETHALTLRYQLGALLGRIVGQPVEGGGGRSGLSRKQQEVVLGFLRSHLTQRLHVRALAAQVELNADYFSRQFHKSFGISPQGWITRARMQRAAAQLLETDLRIKQIAGELGFDDLWFFSRQFKRVMGRSPRNYRVKGR